MKSTYWVHPSDPAGHTVEEQTPGDGCGGRMLSNWVCLACDESWPCEAVKQARAEADRG